MVSNFMPNKKTASKKSVFNEDSRKNKHITWAKKFKNRTTE